MSAKEREQIGCSFVSLKISEGLKKFYASKTREELSAIRRRAWDTRGRILPITLPVVLPLLEAGRSTAEIQEETCYSINQVTRVRKHSRRNNLLPRPTPQSTHESRSKAHKGKIPPNKGVCHSFETRAKMTEQRRGRPLTEVEREQLRLVVRARGIIKMLGGLSFREFCREQGMNLGIKGKNRYFLETFYSMVLSRLHEEINGEEGNGRFSISIDELRQVYEKIDPGVFGRLQKRLVFIEEALRKERPIGERQIGLLEKAREILSTYKEYDPIELFKRYNKFLLVKGRDLDFLIIFSAVRVGMMEGGNNGHGNGETNGKAYISVAELELTYEENPNIFERLRSEINFIRERIPTFPRQRVAVQSRNDLGFARIIKFYRQAGIDFSES